MLHCNSICRNVYVQKKLTFAEAPAHFIQYNSMQKARAKYKRCGLKINRETQWGLFALGCWVRFHALEI